MAETGSTGLAFGAALIGLGAVFAAFLALRLVASLLSALNVGGAVRVEAPPAAQKSSAPAPASPAQPVSPSQGAGKPAPPPSGEVVAAIGAALSLHGAGDEVVAAIATALFLDGAKSPAHADFGGAQRSLWSSAGKIDSHHRRIAVQARQKR